MIAACMDYETLTLLELKKLCKERGLKISGNKDDVVIRLMEYDEIASGPRTVTYQPAGLAGPIPSVQQIVMPPQNNMYQTLGTFVMIYAFIRIVYSWFWSFRNEQILGWLLAPVGFFIGMGLLVGGALIHQEYKNGILLTMGVLVVSGILLTSHSRLA